MLNESFICVECKQPNIMGLPIYSLGKNSLVVLRCSNSLHVHNLVPLDVRGEAGHETAVMCGNSPIKWLTTIWSSVGDNKVLNMHHFKTRVQLWTKIGHETDHKCGGSYRLCRQRVRVFFLLGAFDRTVFHKIATRLHSSLVSKS